MVQPAYHEWMTAPSWMFVLVFDFDPPYRPRMPPRTPGTLARKQARPDAQHTLAPAAAYAYFLAEAQALQAERVRVCRTDLALAQNNLALGLSAVEPELARLRKELPALPVAELPALPALLAAVRHATARISELQTGSGEGFEARYARARALREPLLDFAEVLVQRSLLPAGRVSRIRAGTGSYDAGQDCIDLADLFTEFAAALKNKSPFDAAYLAETRAAGLALTGITTPTGGRSSEGPELVAAVDAKNRLWTLLEDRHQVLRKVGFYLFGDRAAELVPVLGSRLRTATGAEQPEPGPSADPGADPPPQ